MKIDVVPVTPDRWNDFETLFGKRGACGGCWCMLWRLPRKEYEANKGDGNHDAMQRIIESGEVPGLLAYTDSIPIGWCAIAPREVYVSLERSRVLQPVDDKPVWSVACLFVDKRYRKKGVSVKLLEAAGKYVWSKRGKVLEGYPVEPAKGDIPPAFAWTGIPSAFIEAGFVEVARRSPTRPIMRLTL